MADAPPPPSKPPPPITTKPGAYAVCDAPQKKVSALVEKQMSTLAWRDGRGGLTEYSMEVDGKKISFSQRTQSELTGFGTGGNVWNGAIVLCKYLEKKYGNGTHNGVFEGKTVFEIGSGTGVAGIACAQVMKGAHFILTDQVQAIVPIAGLLVWPQRNSESIPELKTVSVQELNWGPDVSHLKPPPPYDWIIACECVAPIFRLDLLLQSLLALTSEKTTILMAYEHRSEVCRVEFFQKAAVHFDFTRVPESDLHPKYSTDDIEIWLIRRKKTA